MSGRIKGEATKNSPNARNPTRNNNDKSQYHQVTKPHAASQITSKTNDGSNSNNEPLNQNEEQPITVIQNTTEVQVRIDENDPRPRRSERQNKSIYDGKYKGYVK